MASPKEVEIKFRIGDRRALERRLRAAGFGLQTRRTHELNTLYDLTGRPLRRRGELLRLRRYGKTWTLTHKSAAQIGRHKTRVELETEVGDGEKLDAVLRALGFEPTFRYEKYRSEWSDGQGQVVVDETPIGDLAEIEGPPQWIDRVAQKLGVASKDYITDSYAGLFFTWKAETGSEAEEMTFRAVKGLRRRRKIESLNH